MKTINLAGANRSLAEYAADLGEEIVVLTDPEFPQLIAEARAEIAAGRKLSLDEMKSAVLPKPSPGRGKRPRVRAGRG
jgi:hypothetical protein